MQECPGQIEDAQSKAGMRRQVGDVRGSWGCSGHLNCLLPSDASLVAPCLAGFSRRGGPPAATLCRQPCRGLPVAPGAGRRSLPLAWGPGADWPRGAVAAAVPRLTVGPGVRLVPRRTGIILLNPSERHRWMRLEPPSGSPVSPGAQSGAGGGTAAIPQAGRPPCPQPPARCCTGPWRSRHRSCAHAEGRECRGWVWMRTLAKCVWGRGAAAWLGQRALRSTRWCRS